MVILCPFSFKHFPTEALELSFDLKTAPLFLCPLPILSFLPFPVMSCDFFAGWVGGCCGILFGHPFDTLKVRQQALNTTSVTATVREAVNSGLFTTLKRGLAFPLISAGAINSVFFGVYGLSADLLAKEGQPLSYAQ